MRHAGFVPHVNHLHSGTSQFRKGLVQVVSHQREHTIHSEQDQGPRKQLSSGSHSAS
jgi:hypothetical protein